MFAERILNSTVTLVESRSLIASSFFFIYLTQRFITNSTQAQTFRKAVRSVSFNSIKKHSFSSFQSAKRFDIKFAGRLETFRVEFLFRVREKSRTQIRNRSQFSSFCFCFVSIFAFFIYDSLRLFAIISS